MDADEYQMDAVGCKSDVNRIRIEIVYIDFSRLSIELLLQKASCSPGKVPNCRGVGLVSRLPEQSPRPYPKYICKSYSLNNSNRGKPSPCSKYVTTYIV
jgi:hypothetical protein